MTKVLYRSVINVTFISDIVSHTVVIWHLIKAMTDVENILNNDEFFADTVDTPKRVLSSIENENF